MNLCFGNIKLTEEAYEELAIEWRTLGDLARESEESGYIGRLQGFERMAERLGIMPGIRRADERLQRQRAA